MENLTKAFADTFKFLINQEVRHRGDTKQYTADMGLLVLQRCIIESEDDNNNKTYERFYHCRMIRFSGSGDVARFSEKELISIKEYEEKKMKDDFEREQMRQDAKRVEKEVMELFGVTKDDYLYLKDENGNVDKSKRFRMSGFAIDEKGVRLHLRESLMTAAKNDEVKRDSKDISSKDDFVKAE